MTRRFAQGLAAFLFLMVLYTGLRAGFYAANVEFYRAVSGAELAQAFLVGLRFDAAALLLLNVPLLVLLLLPWDPARFAWYRRMLFALFILLNTVGILLNLADYAYFPTIQRRLMYEPYTQLPDITRMVPGLLQRYTLLALLFAVLTAGFAYLSARVLRAAGRRWPMRSLPREFALLVLAVVLAILGIRGGLQLKPIRQANAFFSANTAVGYLALNSTYTVVRSLFQPVLPTYAFLSRDEARAATDSMLTQEGERSLDPAYPFLRTSPHQGPMLRRNVVVIIMESWTSVFISSITGKRGATPFFDSLATEGALYTNFIANGQRSIEAVPSILASVPGLFSSSLIGSQAELTRYRGLGDILREQGYATSFLHGAATGSMGFDAFSRIAGFERYVGKEDYPSPVDSLFDGVWGLNDEPFFLDAARRMTESEKPFCFVLFSLSSHDPFELPRHRAPLFAPFTEDTDFERSLRYSDFSLMQFFHAARHESWYDSTVFVITGDHTLFGARNSFHSSFHIPLLIYAPGLVPPQQDARPGSHVDILPTLLDLLRVPAAHASMGRSLMDSARPGIAVVKFGPQFGIFAGDEVLVHDLDRVVGLFRYREDPQHRRNLASAQPQRAMHMERLLKAYLQEATQAIAEDRVTRRE